MEARPINRRRDLLLLALFTIALHLPFLHQPVEGDEGTYLDIARNILHHPLTPLNFEYVFRGQWVSAAGHPHPPLDAYILALAWLIRGHFSLVFFHCVYLAFAVAISFAAYALAARFTDRPLWAALLLAASPIVQVNSNTVASPEVPGLAFMLIGAAAFFWQRYTLSGVALSLAGLTELQAFAIPPVLFLSRPPRRAWPALAAPYVVMLAWQAFQFAMTGTLPGAKLAGYAQLSDYSAPGLKAASALALLCHLGVLVTCVPIARRRLWTLISGIVAFTLATTYPVYERAILLVAVALGLNAIQWLWESRRLNAVLSWWALLYFAFASVVFFAGAARYLLPLAAPMVLLLVLQRRPRYLAAALSISTFVGLNLSYAAYEFSRVYAEVPPPPSRPFLVNGEWGFRYYQLEKGGRVLESRSIPKPGEWIVASQLSLAGNYDSLAEESATAVRTAALTVRTPLRLIAPDVHSGFSSAAWGVLPFSFSTAPLDRITYSRTSPFLAVPAWTPAQISGHLVYIPSAPVTLRLGGPVHFALFARGHGTATYRIGDIFEKTAQVSGDLWEPQTIDVPGKQDVVLTIDASLGLRAGWGEMIAGRTPENLPPLEPQPFLNIGDIRTRPQLLSGFYGIEDGAWRWMSRDAEVELPRPAAPNPAFELRLYFPEDHLKKAGGPITVTVTLNGKPIAQETYTTSGGHQLTAPAPFNTPIARIGIHFNRAVPPTTTDRRELGAVVTALGFRP